MPVADRPGSQTMATKSVEEIVRQQKPGFHVVERRDLAAADSPGSTSCDATSQSMEELKRKYLGTSAGADDPNRGTVTPRTQDDLEIVAVEPETHAADAAGEPSKAKSVVVSKRLGRIIGEQG